MIFLGEGMGLFSFAVNLLVSYAPMYLYVTGEMLLQVQGEFEWNVLSMSMTALWNMNLQKSYARLDNKWVQYQTELFIAG